MYRRTHAYIRTYVYVRTLSTNTQDLYTREYALMDMCTYMSVLGNYPMTAVVIIFNINNYYIGMIFYITFIVGM